MNEEIMDATYWRQKYEQMKAEAGVLREALGKLFHLITRSGVTSDWVVDKADKIMNSVSTPASQAHAERVKLFEEFWSLARPVLNAVNPETPVGKVIAKIDALDGGS